MRPGAIGFISTSGELLRWHPHLHVLLADGGWLPDGTFRHLPFFDTVAIERLFRAEVLRLLVARGKITEEVVDDLLAWTHRGFSVTARSGSRAGRTRLASAGT